MPAPRPALVPFRALSPEGKLNALRKWQPDFFTGDPEGVDSLTDWQEKVKAHWECLSDAMFTPDNSGRMY